MGKPKLKKSLHPAQHLYRKRNISHHQRSHHSDPQQNLHDNNRQLNYTHLKSPHKNTPNEHLFKTPNIPPAWNSLLPNSPLSLSPPRLFSRSRSLNRLPTDSPDHLQKHRHSQPSKARQRAKSASAEYSQELLGVTLCSTETGGRCGCD